MTDLEKLKAEVKGYCDYNYLPESPGRKVVHSLLAAVEEMERRLKIFLKDTSDDMECLPECDSFGHAEFCPVVHPWSAWRQLREQLASKDAEIVELTEHYKIACVDRESLGKERDKLLRQLADKDKCAYIGPMRDCPTHGESPKLQRAREALEKAVDVILWMSGSADFAPGGQAHQGWLKAQSDIEIIRAALREIGGEHEPQS